ncbi:MAG TPA: PKD domain-containing protein, partial [Kofleriaceae bacterium]|nr:PKD domain-containing protein [Kofleriaceae bacterium]
MEDPAPPPANATASAGPDQQVSRGASVRLDGTASADPDGDPLRYTWTQLHGPDVTGGTGSLDGAAPSFVAPEGVATLVFELRVDDGHGASDPDPIQINVLEDASAALFVAGDLGDDESGNGTIDRPFASIGRALAEVTDVQEDLYVMIRAGGGRYDETGAALAVPAGTSLYGGYDAGWRRDVAIHRTGVDTDHRGLRITGALDFDTWISGLELVTADAPGAGDDVTGIAAAGGAATLYLHDNAISAGSVAAGAVSAPGSSYGVQLRDLASVEILRNTIRAGSGGAGGDGAPGAAGERGADGANASGEGSAAGGSSSS